MLRRLFLHFLTRVCVCVFVCVSVCCVFVPLITRNFQKSKGWIWIGSHDRWAGVFIWDDDDHTVAYEMPWRSGIVYLKRENFCLHKRCSNENQKKKKKERKSRKHS